MHISLVCPGDLSYQSGIPHRQQHSHYRRQRFALLVKTGQALWLGVFIPHALAQTNLPGNLDLSFDPGNGRHGANGSVHAVVLQPDGKAIIGGQFTEVGGVARRGYARINADGTLDPHFVVNPGIDDFIYIGGYYEPGPPFVTALVDAIALQSDGKAILGGMFGRVDGLSRSNLVRLNTDGSVDNTFSSQVGGTARPRIRALAVQSDGKILAGGDFTLANGMPRTSLARFNNDGTLDLSFAPQLSGTSIVETILVQTNGRIVIGGEFDQVNENPMRNLARLLTTGLTDLTFHPGDGPDARVRSLALSSGAKIVVGGSFTNFAGQLRPGIVRIQTNGAVDLTFHPDGGPSTFGDPFEVTALAVDDSDNVLVGGLFTYMNGTWRQCLSRLRSDGSLDAAFALGAFGRVQAFAAQGDGQTIVAGDFNALGGISRAGFGRMDVVGIGDAAYTSGTGLDNAVSALAVEPAGKVIVGGWFQSVSGEWRRGLARLQTNGALDRSFSNSVPFSFLRKMIRQPDGKLLVAGGVEEPTGLTEQLLRLGTNGQVDSTFPPLTAFSLQAVELATDGSIIVGGWSFTGASTETQVLRLDSTGVRDASFQAQLRFNLYALTRQPDDKIILGGISNQDCDFRRTLHILRLNADGSPDTNFVFVPSPEHALTEIFQLWAQHDGRILVYGRVDHPQGLWRAKLIRLLSNGQTDSSFNPDFTNYQLNDLLVLSDGRMLAAGNFAINGGWATLGVVRMESSGVVDGTFWAGNDLASLVTTLALGNEGQVFIGGYFANVNQIPRAYIARLYGGELPPGPPVIQTPPSYPYLTWGEEGRLNVIVGRRPAPSYQWYFNDIPVLGATNATLSLFPATTNHNGNYFVTASNMFGSATSQVSVVTVATQPKVVMSSDQFETVTGTRASLSATVHGQPPLSLQWKFAGMPLPGATNATLTLSNVTAAEGGAYTLTASNATGSATGDATLTVLLPLTLSAPTATWGPPTFNVTGSPDRFINIHRSTDLQVWECFYSGRLSSDGTLSVHDFPTPVSNRFFRAFYPIRVLP